MSGCGSAGCSCGDNCQCGSSCKCGKRSFDETMLISTKGSMEMSDVATTVESNTEGDCKCGPNCTCSPCKCNQ